MTIEAMNIGKVVLESFVDAVKRLCFPINGCLKHFTIETRTNNERYICKKDIKMDVIAKWLISRWYFVPVCAYFTRTGLKQLICDYLAYADTEGYYYNFFVGVMCRRLELDGYKVY